MKTAFTVTDWEKATEEYWAKFDRAFRMKRISQRSLILAAGDICKIVWPHVKTGKLKKSRDVIKNNRRKKRMNDFERFIPASKYPALLRGAKVYRNCIEHYDDMLDRWNETSPHHNIASGIIGSNSISGNIDIMDSLDPLSLEMQFYDDGEIKLINLINVNGEILEIAREIHEMEYRKIRGFPPGFP